MKLQSVICAEGTHYVCFAQSQGQWVFFDSMAKTVGKLRHHETTASLVPKHTASTASNWCWSRVRSGDKTTINVHVVTYYFQVTIWLFTDDTYSIPKVVDCTRELNEWVYNNKDPNHHRLMNTPTQKVPEYVRRFTRDVYICVYIVPDI